METDKPILVKLDKWFLCEHAKGTLQIKYVSGKVVPVGSNSEKFEPPGTDSYPLQKDKGLMLSREYNIDFVEIDRDLLSAVRQAKGNYSEILS